MSKNYMEKPRKCPHCYNENINIQIAHNEKGKRFYRCKCHNCNIANKYWHDTEIEAIEFWNDGVISDCGVKNNGKKLHETSR